VGNSAFFAQRINSNIVTATDGSTDTERQN
jgi:hypothetical protein